MERVLLGPCVYPLMNSPSPPLQYLLWAIVTSMALWLTAAFLPPAGALPLWLLGLAAEVAAVLSNSFVKPSEVWGRGLPLIFLFPPSLPCGMEK